MGTNKRDPGIELYRICLMFGICLLHCVCQGMWRGIWPCNLLGFCVPGFVFISGWFGIKFSLSKVIRLYSIPVYASLLAPLCGGVMGNGYWIDVLRVWDADGGFWFIHAYVILMLFSPLINMMFDKASQKEKFCAVVPIVFIGMCWGVLLNYNHLRLYIPSSSGLESGSSLTFMAIYCIARLCREYRLDEKISIVIAILCSISCTILLSFSRGYFCHINNPVCLVLAASLFVIFKRLEIPNSITKVITFFSPFMFSVYCISGTIYFPFTEQKFFSVIEFIKKSFFAMGFSTYTCVLLAALGSFLIGVIADLPRWLIGRLAKQPIHAFLRNLDNKYENVLVSFSRLKQGCENDGK